jgi:hypothetical protein
LGEGAGEGGAGFDEEDGVRGNGHVGFFGMVVVVEAQAADDGDFGFGDGGEELVGGVSGVVLRRDGSDWRVEILEDEPEQPS